MNTTDRINTIADEALEDLQYHLQSDAYTRQRIAEDAIREIDEIADGDPASADIASEAAKEIAAAR